MTGIVFDPEFGFIFPRFQEGLADVFYKKLLKHKYRQEEISERLSALCRAFRAKEQIIVVAPDFLEFRCFEELIPFVDRLNYKSFHAVFSSVKDSFRRRERASTSSLTKTYETGKALIKDFPKREPLKIRRSASKSEERKNHRFGSRDRPLNKDVLRALELGNTLHEILEVLDFKEDPEALLQGAQLRILEREATETLQGTHFQNRSKATTSTPSISRARGRVIDLILETEEELIILDYKLSNLEKGSTCGNWGCIRIIWKAFPISRFRRICILC